MTPPFNHTPHNPGYIKGYVPGIRENGGQYTHAAVWTVTAFAAMSDGDKAHELFRILNPINRTNSRAGVQRYKVEPSPFTPAKVRLFVDALRDSFRSPPS